MTCRHKYEDTKVVKIISKTAPDKDKYGRLYKIVEKVKILLCVRCCKVKYDIIDTWTTKTPPMTQAERKYWGIRRRD